MAPRTTAPPASPKASDYPLIPDAYLRDPSNPASYADCAAVDSDLTIDKTGPATFQTGQKFSHPYTITVWNKGPAAVRNATLADTLPDTLTVNNFSCQAYDAAGSAMTSAAANIKVMPWRWCSAC